MPLYDIDHVWVMIQITYGGKKEKDDETIGDWGNINMDWTFDDTKG